VQSLHTGLHSAAGFGCHSLNMFLSREQSLFAKEELFDASGSMLESLLYTEQVLCCPWTKDISRQIRGCTEPVSVYISAAIPIVYQT
jgi:hypothetical protein